MTAVGRFSFLCPHCSVKIDAKVSKAGAANFCPGCKKALVIPNPSVLAADKKPTPPPRPTKKPQPRRKPIWQEHPLLFSLGVVLLSTIPTVVLVWAIFWPDDKYERQSSQSSQPRKAAVASVASPVRGQSSINPMVDEFPLTGFLVESLKLSPDQQREALRLANTSERIPDELLSAVGIVIAAKLAETKEYDSDLIFGHTLTVIATLAGLNEHDPEQKKGTHYDHVHVLLPMQGSRFHLDVNGYAKHMVAAMASSRLTGEVVGEQWIGDGWVTVHVRLHNETADRIRGRLKVQALNANGEFLRDSTLRFDLSVGETSVEKAQFFIQKSDDLRFLPSLEDPEHIPFYFPLDDRDDFVKAMAESLRGP